MHTWARHATLPGTDRRVGLKAALIAVYDPEALRATLREGGIVGPVVRKTATTFLPLAIAQGRVERIDRRTSSSSTPAAADCLLGGGEACVAGDSR